VLSDVISTYHDENDKQICATEEELDWHKANIEIYGLEQVDLP
jgi:hypothetical protein